MKTQIIVDIGSNWCVGNNPKQRAFDLSELALDCGANVVKFQLFDRLYRDNKKQQSLNPYKLPIDWLSELKEHIESNGGEFLVTPFYIEAVDILEDIGVQRYKVASPDIIYYPLLERISATGKPVILSTGGASFGNKNRPKNLYDTNEPRGEVDIALSTLSA